jgi:hypothetical protein
MMMASDMLIKEEKFGNMKRQIMLIRIQKIGGLEKLM